MDITSTSQAIQMVGFPIICVLGLAFFIYKIWQKMQENQDKLTMTLVEVNTTNRELSETNKELSETNRKLVEQFTNDLASIKEDMKDIKEAVSK
ncbi:hypothetical protein [Sporanaerobium hydrogeniformans]|uniref:hypothetical protein n=1 Tax=Sporanaerobium hydrogeniformans TaxID=3072179 RepID=UPI00117ABBAE|nr:hypothetical protein [Sporanaerobium hydrogeniformans]